MSVLWCSFCCAGTDELDEAGSDAHVANFGSGCPHRTEPCDSPDCTNGDHSCVAPGLRGLTEHGCDECRWTGYCPKCKGSGDMKPMEHHKREYRNAAARARRRMAS